MVSIPTPNLTTGKGQSTRWILQDWVRAIRHGVGPDGRALFIMPSKKFQYMSDEDLGAIVADIESRRGVDNQLPEKRVEFVGRVMVGAGLFPPFAAATLP